MGGGNFSDYPRGPELIKLLAYLRITKKEERERIKPWAKAQATNAVLTRRGKPAKDPYTNAKRNLARWKKGDRPQEEQESLLLAVLNLASREELELLLFKFRRETREEQVAGEVGELVERYDSPGPFRLRMNELYKEHGLAEQLRKLKGPAAELAETYLKKTVQRTGEADLNFSVLLDLLDLSKTG